jgi:hypothetical protein
MMAVALTLHERRAVRHLRLYDTFEGMSEPTSVDKDFNGIAAADLLAPVDATDDLWAVGPLAEVKRNLASTAYDLEYVSFIVGKVEDTLPAHAPEQIALLRLDTDWYESTYHEMVHLFPRLSVGGVLIIDDYGHWQGARRAIDQYIQEKGVKLLLNRIDYTCRIGVKVEPSSVS